MATLRDLERAKRRKDQAKRAIALAMQSRWSDAVEANLSITRELPDDLEAYNRLGKALTELGRVREARGAFRRALELSPHNAIAQKNLSRLMQLGDDVPRSRVVSGSTPHAFIEESGKTGVTSLIGLGSQKLILKMAPGHPVELQTENGKLEVTDPTGEYVGQVEPKLASRLIRLIKGGNRYRATVTSIGDQVVNVIVREVYQHPSQSGTVSFPSRGRNGNQVYMPNSVQGLREEGSGESGPVAVKDWSDDDTEPGDDDAFSPVVHRIISPAGDGGQGDDG